MAGRIYVATFKNVVVSAVQDLFSLNPGANKPVEIHALYLSQTTEVADAAEEQLLIELITGNTSTGSGGAAVTANPMNLNDAVDAATVRANDTVEVSAGTAVSKHLEAWNVRMPFIYHPDPEDRIVTSNTFFFAAQLLTTPADDITMSGTLIYKELV